MDTPGFGGEGIPCIVSGSVRESLATKIKKRHSEMPWRFGEKERTLSAD